MAHWTSVGVGEPARDIVGLLAMTDYPRVCGGTPSAGWWSHYEIISLIDAFVYIRSSCHCNSSVRVLIFSNSFGIHE